MKSIKRIAAMVLALAILVIGASSVAFAGGQEYTTTANLNMRMGAGKGYALITTLNKGVSVTRLDSAKASNGITWYKVETKDGIKGWCCASYLKAKGTPSPTPVTGNKVKMSGDAFIRSAASLDGIEMDVAKKGTTLTYDDAKKDWRGVTWYHVTKDGYMKGWVSSKYAKVI